VVPRLRWIKALHALYWDFLDFPNLPNQFLLAGHLSNLLVLHPFGSFLKFLTDLVPDLSVLQVLVLNSLLRFDFLLVDCLDDFFVLLEVFLKVVLAFLHQLVHFFLHFDREGVVLMDLLLLSQNCLFP
jgi:hypothetical protein